MKYWVCNIAFSALWGFFIFAIGTEFLSFDWWVLVVCGGLLSGLWFSRLGLHP